MPKAKKPATKTQKRWLNGNNHKLFGIPLMPAIFVLTFACITLSALIITQAQGYETGTDNTQVVLTNNYRAARGLPKLRTSGCLTNFARYWAKHMSDSGTMHHSSGGYINSSGSRVHTNDPGLVNLVDFFCGRSPWTRLGENVGVTSNDSHALFTAFVNSPAHRANIVGQYNLVGVGSYRRGDGKMFMTVLFANCVGCNSNWTKAPTAQAKPTNPYTCSSTHPTLGPSSTNTSCIRHLQWYLNYIAGQAVAENGKYDAATVNSVKNIERFFGIPVDGIADSNVWNTLHYVYSVR